MVATPKEGAIGMDVDLPLMEEVEEANDGNNNIPETQDDCISLSNMVETGEEEEE